MRTCAAAMSIVFLSACTSGSVRTDPGQATYFGIFDEPVTLSDGRFEGAAFVSGGASRPMVRLLDAPGAAGDLNGDGVAEQVVVLAASSGGSGTFVYLAVLERSSAAIVNLATEYIGDRVRVTALQIESGILSAQLLAHGPGDPSCCPSEQIVRNWWLVDGGLVEFD